MTENAAYAAFEVAVMGWITGHRWGYKNSHESPGWYPVIETVESMWMDSIISWAHSQKSRRIALRCLEHERKALQILSEAF